MMNEAAEMIESQSSDPHPEGTAMITLIAEVSTNHGGDLDRAKRFIDAYAFCTYVKFQWTRHRRLAPDDPQSAWFTQAEISDDGFAELAAYCQQRGTQFLATVYHADDVEAYRQVQPQAIKIGSGEAGDRALSAAAIGYPLRFVGAGIVSPVPHLGVTRVLRCVSRYPTPMWWARHQAIQPYHERYCGTECGWSDHAIGIEACEAAIMAGATVIEKHVSLPDQARPVKPFEATVDEMRRLRAFADQDPRRFLGRWQHGA